MTSTRYRIGVIGAGGIARGAHLPAWKRIKEAEIVGIADVNPAAAALYAEDAGVEATFTDPKELLKLGVDAVDICTPSALHADIVEAALEAGCHVLCEKPLTTSTADLKRIGSLADDKGLLLMSGQHYRFQPDLIAAKRFAEAGALGDVYHSRVLATRRAHLPVKPSFINGDLSGGGPCMDIGVHTLDACMWVLDFPKPVRVTGVTRTNFAKGYEIPGQWGEWDRETFNVEDFAAGFVHFEDGSTMAIEASWLSHQEIFHEMRWHLFGSKASLQWPEMQYATTLNRVFSQGQLTPSGKKPNPYAAEIQAFVNTLIEGEQSLIPWWQTMHTLAVLEAIYRAAGEGQEVTIDGDLFDHPQVKPQPIERFEDAARQAI